MPSLACATALGSAYRERMATGFRIPTNEKTAKAARWFQRHPWVTSGVVAAEFGVIVGTARSWFKGAFVGVLMLLLWRFVIGPYIVRRSLGEKE